MEICFLRKHFQKQVFPGKLNISCFLFQAKVIMKNANILPKLQETLNSLDNHPESNLADKCIADIEAVIATVSE